MSTEPMSTEELLGILQGVDNEDEIQDILMDHIDEEDLEPPGTNAGAHTADNIVVDTPSRPAVPRRNLRVEDVERDWSSDSFTPTVDPFDDFSSGLNPNELRSNDSALDYFQYFLDTNIMMKIIFHINQFHNFFVLNTDLRTHSRLQRWMDVTVPELYIFLAIVMLMTRNRHLTIEEHWSTDAFLYAPIFGHLMTRNRFCTILGMLHFCTPTRRSQSPLDKISLVINHARNKYKNAITPFKEICIDESIVPFKGRLSIKQYLPKKRNRFGIKLFVLCDVKTGMVVDFIVYCGANTEVVDPANLGVGGAVVSTLLRGFLGSHRHLYVDNWYSSPKLFQYLHTHKIYACGTVKPNRKGMPRLQQKLKQGDVVHCSSPPLNVIKWHDKKDIHILTTIHDNKVVPSLKEDRSTGLPKMKPLCVLDYSKNMGSVDTCDMMLSSVQCIRKSIKWYKKLFFHVIDMHLLNAFYAFKIAKQTPNARFAEFQLEVIRQITLKYNAAQHMLIQMPPRVSTATTASNPLRILPGEAFKHMPFMGPKHRRCTNCAKNKIRRETRYMCQVCKVYLCAAPCFYDYHQ